MLQTVIGPRRDASGIDLILRALTEQPWTGTFYTGFPVLTVEDEQVVVDAFLTCREHGVVLLELRDNASAETWTSLSERQDLLYQSIYAALLSSGPLVVNRRPIVDVTVITVLPNGTRMAGRRPTDVPVLIATPETLLTVLRDLDSIDAATLKRVDSAVQRLGAIRPSSKRPAASRDDSRAGKLERIEKQIRTFDRWQKAAAIEVPDGPQRIRGLAGSGKTVVLAHKAAYLHATRPDWNIVLTFYTRTLYPQLRSLVERFYYEQTRNSPNWERLHILHAWGGKSRPGVYSTLAEHAGVAPKNWTEAAREYGAAAFEGVCDELLAEVNTKPFSPIYDVVLVDEAQDFPRSFFELAYLSTSRPHRVVWAYDELQNLGDYEMAAPATLFGCDEHGSPRLSGLTNRPNAPQEDIILPVCYRNTPWALTIAHALGFGIYRKEGLVQFFDSPQLWRDIGYETAAGHLSPGHPVTLRRAKDASPSFFGDLLDPADAVLCMKFADVQEQADWVASQIHENIERDELTARDIIVVMAAATKIEERSARLLKALAKLGIPAHIVGVNSSKDSVHSDNPQSVAILNTLRAKGNEAPMVYVMGAEYGSEEWELIKKRNTLFTAITRSRAWVRLCGCGAGMEAVKKEVNKVVAKSYELQLTVPTAEQLRRLRNIHRDMSGGERELVLRGKAGIAALAQLAQEDETLLEAVLGPIDDEERRRLVGALRGMAKQE